MIKVSCAAAWCALSARLVPPSWPCPSPSTCCIMLHRTLSDKEVREPVGVVANAARRRPGPYQCPERRGLARRSGGHTPWVPPTLEREIGQLRLCACTGGGLMVVVVATAVVVTAAAVVGRRVGWQWWWWRRQWYWGCCNWLCGSGCCWGRAVRGELANAGQQGWTAV